MLAQQRFITLGTISTNWHELASTFLVFVSDAVHSCVSKTCSQICLDHQAFALLISPNATSTLFTSSSTSHVTLSNKAISLFIVFTLLKSDALAPLLLLLHPQSSLLRVLKKKQISYRYAHAISTDITSSACMNLNSRISRCSCDSKTACLSCLNFSYVLLHDSHCARKGTYSCSSGNKKYPCLETLTVLLTITSSWTRSCLFP